MLVGLFLGKPVGILIASWLAVRAGLLLNARHLPFGLAVSATIGTRWRDRLIGSHPGYRALPPHLDGQPLAGLAQTYGASEAKSLINRMLALDLKITLADNDLPKVMKAWKVFRSA